MPPGVLRGGGAFPLIKTNSSEHQEAEGKLGMTWDRPSGRKLAPYGMQNPGRLQLPVGTVLSAAFSTGLVFASSSPSDTLK